jgi:hypothetical protein
LSHLRGWIAAGIVIVVLALIAGGVFFLMCRNGEYSRCNYYRVKRGMTLEEVKVLLGPGKQIEDAPALIHDPENPGRLKPVVRGEQYFIWKAPDGMGYITIAFDTEGKVCDKYMWTPMP